MDLSTDQLLQIAFDAVTVGPADLPDDLEARVLSAAGAAAPQGRPARHRDWVDLPDGTPNSLTAFIRTAAELGELLDSLGPDDWGRATGIDGATVRQVADHLVGVERYLLGCLDRRPRLEAPRRQDHWPVSQQAGGAVADAPDGAVAQLWWAEVLDLIDTCAQLGPDAGVVYHHLAGSLRGLLVVRTFELWTHGDDIRQALGRPLDRLDEGRLSLMVRELMRVLPLGLALSDCVQPGRRAAIHLTGPGGGRFDVALDPALDDGVAPAVPATADITITADVIDLCRWAANRLDRDSFAIAVEGDADLVEPILVGAAAFAAD